MLGKLRETGKFDKLKMVAGGQSSSISAVSIIKDFLQELLELVMLHNLIP